MTFQTAEHLPPPFPATVTFRIVAGGVNVFHDDRSIQVRCTRDGRILTALVTQDGEPVYATVEDRDLALHLLTADAISRAAQNPTK